MTFHRLITTAARPTALSLRPTALSLRSIHSSALVRASAGYGDPQDEKIENNTPTPSSTPDPQPAGQGKGTKSQSGTTDPEVKPKKKTKSKSSSSKESDGKSVEEKTGNAGGDGGARTKKTPSEKEIKETKKIGEEPKKEEVGGAGPIGG